MGGREGGGRGAEPREVHTKTSVEGSVFENDKKGIGRLKCEVEKKKEKKSPTYRHWAARQKGIGAISPRYWVLKPFSSIQDAVQRAF